MLGDGAPVVHCVWGDAQWSRTQLLGEIARGHWGLCHASVAEMVAPPSERWAALDGRLVFAPETEMMEDVRALQAPDPPLPHPNMTPTPEPNTLCAAPATRRAQFIRRGVAEMERERALQSRAADASASAVEAAEDAAAAAAAEADESADADADAGEALAAGEAGGEE